LVPLIAAKPAVPSVTVLLLTTVVACGAVGRRPDLATPTPGLDVPKRVLLLTLDGMHEQDLEWFIVARPASALAVLSRQGFRYRQARTPVPSDSYPGLLALITGGTPRSTGVYYDVSYDRRLSPPGSNCSARGTTVDFTEAIDRDPGALDGGGGIDEAKLPRDPDRRCAAVYPHQYLRVNTIFEVAKAAGLRTAWCDKHLSYDIVNGPSGAGVDDLYNPEISANGITRSIVSTEGYDDRKVAAVMNQIHGRDHAGAPAAIPALFGMNFQAISVAQKSPLGGYRDASGSPTAALIGALAHTDQSIGRLVNALAAANLTRSTTVIITASHGQSPIDPARRRLVSPDAIPKLVNDVRPDLLAAATQDDVALLWLQHSAVTNAVASHLKAHAAQVGIEDVLFGDDLKKIFGDHGDARMPDLIVRSIPGVIYAQDKGPGKGKIAEHGGFSDDDRHVPLLIVVPGAARGVDDRPVETRQLAPTILAALNLDPNQLQALREEKATPLPGLLLPLAGR
jgi:Type I phosphodiesterase / nucleotide pyrophosphatase